jgi:hypothetical protein
VADSFDREYRPELIPRRGEWSAWGSALLAGIAWLVLRSSGSSVSMVMFFLTIILALAALSISLSNWSDRQTIIHLTDNWIEFNSGLRHVRVNWPEIRQVRVLSSRWGDKVHVIGDRSHFSFRKLGEVWYENELRGRMGFEKGDEILHKIIVSSDLKKIVEQDGEGSYYACYARYTRS